MTNMEARSGFGKAARKFEMTVSLQEGYHGGKVHDIGEVFALIKTFAVEHRIEFGCEIISSTIIYSYLDQGKMTVHQEPAVKLVGLFPPNKFGSHKDDALAEIIAKLAAHMAAPLGQTSFHAEVCGVHYAWKVSGKLTSHEVAQKKASS